MRHFRAMSAVFAGRMAYQTIRLFNLGYGSAFPGYIARSIFSDIFGYLSTQIKGDVIYITGTNGKTTTTHFLTTLIGKNNLIYNGSGANLENGIITSLVNKATVRAKIKANKAIFEVDEKILPKVLQERVPALLICLNLFRDQMERYGEIELTKNKWKEAIDKLPESTKLLFNGDDPLLVHLSHELRRPVHFFGMSEEGKIQSAFFHAVDSIRCPYCFTNLEYKNIFLAHLGDYYCKGCDFKRGPCMFDGTEWQAHFPQTHNKYNVLAAVCAASLSGKAEEEIRREIKKCLPPSGRGEKIRLANTDILLLLSKNPVSLNVSISSLKELKSRGELGGIVIALNDGSADSKDISWIWDGEIAELAELSETFYFTGTRAYEMALCMGYFIENEQRFSSFMINTQIKTLLKMAIRNTPKGKTLCIIATYTALLEIRRGLLNKKELRDATS